MNKPQLDPEDFTLVDRMAAAFMRNDIEGAREIVASERICWERQGAESEQESRRKAVEIQWEFEQRCNAYFETKDGLRVKDKIDGGKYMPYAWKRACRPTFHVVLDDPPDFDPIEVRTYERQGNERDGLPIFREI